MMIINAHARHVVRHLIDVTFVKSSDTIASIFMTMACNMILLSALLFAAPFFVTGKYKKISALTLYLLQRWLLNSYRMRETFMLRGCVHACRSIRRLHRALRPVPRWCAYRRAADTRARCEWRTVAGAPREILHWKLQLWRTRTR